MIIFECDNPKCKKHVRVRGGYSVIREQHFVMCDPLVKGKLVPLGLRDPSYPAKEAERPRHPDFILANSRLPEGWLGGFLPNVPHDLMTFCSSECFTEVIPGTSDSGESPEDRLARIAAAFPKE